MIDKNGDLRCDDCNKKFGEYKDYLRILCPRCDHYNRFKELVLRIFDKKVKV